MIRQIEFSLPPFPRGYHLVTRLVEKQLPPLPEQGLLNLFLKHTSAGLILNENADETVRYDFENIINLIVPESTTYEHCLEGNDDMPAHVKSALTGQSLTIPITNGLLNLGTWQGIYLCEFRNYGGSRQLVATIYS